MTAEQCFKRNSLLVKEIRENHRGGENPLSSEQASKFLSEHGFCVKTKNICKLINGIAKEWCLPICFINAKGYFWATKKSEIQETIADLQSRINALQEHIYHLNSFIIE